MRDLYHDELDQIGNSLVAMTHLAGTAMQRATEALLTGDLSGAERVVSDDNAIDALRADLEARTFLLLSLQQPVATDLRVLVTTLHLVADLERMGDLALHVAKVARMRHPDIAVPLELRDVISQMGAVALSLVDKVAEVIKGRDVQLAQAIEVEDDSMDALHRKLFTQLLADTWSHGTEAAIDMTLLGRYYERYADHAVGVARRIVFIATGSMPAGSAAAKQPATGSPME
jgi:phosphate transport system protein